MAAAVSMILAGGAHAAQQERPNVIVIIADDMGYSDISPFGGEIPTPNLQAMAEQGMRMSQYYTSPMSAPARSMLLTGNSNQQAGMGGMWWYDSTIGKEGYELRLTDRVTTMAERFKDAGYNTLMAGKWHLGFVPGATPKDRGFNHAFAFMGGGTSHFNDAIPLGTVEAFHTSYTRDGERVSLPDDFYSSEAYARQMNSWIKATPKEQPVFAWLAFTAPHDPLQAPDEWIKRFKGQYEQGYAEVYRQRIARLKALGIIHDDTPLPHLELDKEWEALTPEQQKYTAKVMHFHLAADRPQVFDYFDDAEKRGFLVMFGQIPAASDPGHLVPAPEAELRLGVVGFQPFHQVGAVQVARRLAGYQVVTHIVSLILLSANRAAAVWCAPRPAPPSSGRFGRNCPRGARRALSSR